MSVDPSTRPGGARPASAVEGVPRWRGRFLLYGVGAVLLFIGLRGILRHADGGSDPLRWALLVTVGAVAHDLLLVPVVSAVGWPLRHLRPPLRAGVATGLALSGVLLVVAWPALGRYGARSDNPSVLPLDYPHGLAVALGVVWGALLVVVLVRALQLRRGRRRSPPGQDRASAPVPGQSS